MARFKIFSVLTDKIRKISTSAFKKASATAQDWFQSKVQDTFGKKRIKTAGGFNKTEIEAQQAAMDQERARKPRVRPSDAAASPLKRRKEEPGSRKISAAMDTGVKASMSDLKRNLKNVSKPELGGLYFFIYDPKHKKTLPYYDVFPLSLIIDIKNDRMLGLNFHYLNPLRRAVLLDYLFSIKQKFPNKKDSIPVTYGMLKAVGNNIHYKPTIHSYLYGHIRSPLAQVFEAEHEEAVFLPAMQFRKRSSREVWNDSK